MLALPLSTTLGAVFHPAAKSENYRQRLCLLQYLGRKFLTNEGTRAGTLHRFSGCLTTRHSLFVQTKIRLNLFQKIAESKRPTHQPQETVSFFSLAVYVGNRLKVRQAQQCLPTIAKDFSCSATSSNKRWMKPRKPCNARKPFLMRLTARTRASNSSLTGRSSMRTNFLALMGYSLSEVVGQHHRMFCEPSYVSSSEYANFWQRINRGEFVSGRFKRVNKAGKAVWLEATYNPVFDANQRLHSVISNLLLMSRPPYLPPMTRMHDWT